MREVLTTAALKILLRLEPETAHGLALRALDLVHPLLPKAPIAKSLERTCFGLTFAHPLGLAAGFDKNGDHLEALGALGFAHIEAGTVTPLPQPGNNKPRLFRLLDQKAIINRMGFNNKGIEHLAAQLTQSRYRGVRGVSLGKNATTPLERAAEDYLIGFRRIYPLADYIAVNVSSPNTVRLRELQSAEGLESIVGSLFQERPRLADTHGKQVPLLVKIAPDLEIPQIESLARTLQDLGVDGVIATNTTTQTADIPGIRPEHAGGGLSGWPLHQRSLQVIRCLRATLGRDFPLIGVGGITSAEEALETLDAGADLIQLYTGLVYQGPGLIREILATLSATSSPSANATPDAKLS